MKTKGNYNNLFDYWTERSISNSNEADLLRATVRFMNDRDENLNYGKSTKELIKEYLQYYYDYFN